METEKKEALKEILADSLVEGLFRIDGNCIDIEKSSAKWSLLDYLQNTLMYHGWTIDEIFTNLSDELTITCKPKRESCINCSNEIDKNYLK